MQFCEENQLQYLALHFVCILRVCVHQATYIFQIQADFYLSRT